MGSRCHGRVLAILLAALLIGARSAAAAPPGCVDLLLHCDATSELLQTLCGPGPHSVPQGDTSYVIFGPGVTSVTLERCDTQETAEIFGDTNLCDIPGDFNDQVCGLTIATAVPTLGGSSSGPVWIGVALVGIGVLGLWRRRAAGADRDAV